MKGLQTQNLRDHMSKAELIFTALAELSTRQIAETIRSTGMEENTVEQSHVGSFLIGFELIQFKKEYFHKL